MSNPIALAREAIQKCLLGLDEQGMINFLFIYKVVDVYIQHSLALSALPLKAKNDC